MIAAGLQGVEFIVANTDAQALTMSRAKGIIQMGTQVTGGLGAGSQPEVRRAAAEEATSGRFALIEHAQDFKLAPGRRCLSVRKVA